MAVTGSQVEAATKILEIMVELNKIDVFRHGTQFNAMAGKVGQLVSEPSALVIADAAAYQVIKKLSKVLVS